MRMVKAQQKYPDVSEAFRAVCFRPNRRIYLKLLSEHSKRREIPPPPQLQVTRESNPQPAVLETAALPIELVTYRA